MAAKVTALFEAKDKITPELVKIQRGVDNTRRSFGGFERGYGRTASSFQRDTQRMQREIRDLRSDLNRLGGMHERARVSVDDQATNQISDIRQQLLGLGSLAAGIVIGVNAGDVMTEVEATFRERSYLAAKGKTEQEMKRLDQMAKDLTRLNPFLSQQEAYATVAKSDQLNGKSAGQYAEASSKLNVTTKYTPEEHLNIMTVMRQNTGVDDATRLGNAIQYMNNNLKDFKGEFVDSMIEYSTQTNKFLDTPEKMAALIGEMGKMEIWSVDKGFDALKETTLKLTNQGDLTNVLKTGYETQGMKSDVAQKQAQKEADLINKLLSSNDKSDNQKAMGRLMLGIASIQDKQVQQQVLNELGAGPGEDLGRQFAPLLQIAGKLSTGEYNPQIGNEMDKAYQAAVKGNPLFEFQKAQMEAKHATIELAGTIAKDVTPTLAGLSDATAAVIRKFNDMPEIARHGAYLTAAGLIIGGGGLFLFKSATAHMRAASALEDAAQALKDSGGSDVDIGPDSGGDNDNTRKKRKRWGSKKNASVEELLDMESDRLQRKDKWSKFNPFSKKTTKVEAEPFKPDYNKFGFGKGNAWKNDPDYYLEKKWGGTGASQVKETSLLSGLKDKLTSIPASVKDSGGKMWTGLKDAISATKNAIADTGGKLWQGVKNVGEAAKGPLAKYGGKLLRGVPLVGTALGIGGVLMADDKPTELLRHGAELGGGALGGAIGGAAVGSIVPVVGTAIGGLFGSIAGAIGGGVLFDKAKEWMDTKPTLPPYKQDRITPSIDEERRLQRLTKVEQPVQKVEIPVQKPVPISVVAPVSKKDSKPKTVTVSGTKVEIKLNVDGILQDIASMVKMIDSPEVKNKILSTVEKALIDAIETSGGAARVGGVPQ